MWKIIPMDVGAIQVPKSNLYQNEQSHERVPVPAVVWLLINEKDGRKLLIDAGPKEDATWGELHHNPCLRARKDNYLVAALAKHHTTPEEIEAIILSHLHWDHAYGVELIPNARVIVQSAELRHAVSRCAKDAKLYETDLPENPFFLSYYHRLDIISGDTELFDGISVCMLPGHSPGSMGVLVQGEDSEYLIAGDLVNIIENYTERQPAGLYTDLDACYASLDRMAELNRTRGAIVLPSHDYRVFDRFGQAHQ